MDVTPERPPALENFNRRINEIERNRIVHLYWCVCTICQRSWEAASYIAVRYCPFCQDSGTQGPHTRIKLHQLCSKEGNLIHRMRWALKIEDILTDEYQKYENRNDISNYEARMKMLSVKSMCLTFADEPIQAKRELRFHDDLCPPFKSYDGMEQFTVVTKDVEGKT